MRESDCGICIAVIFHVGINLTITIALTAFGTALMLILMMIAILEAYITDGVTKETNILPNTGNARVAEPSLMLKTAAFNK